MGLLFITRIALGFQFQVVGSITPRLVEELQIDYRLAGILVGMFLLAGIFISFPAGLIQRFTTEKTLVVGGLCLLGIGGFISGYASSYGLIAFGRIVSGAGFVFSTLYFTKMVTDWFSGKELATAMAILVMSWPVGIALGQVVHPIIAGGYGYSSAFVIASVYCVFSAIVIWWFYRSPVIEGNVQQSAPPVWKLSRYHLKLTLFAALVWALFNAVYVVFLSFVVELLVSHGFGEQQAGAVGSIPSWIMVFTAIAAGVLVDRTGKRDIVLYVSLITSAVSLVLLSAGVAIYFNILLLGTIGFGSAGVIMSLTGEAMPPESRAFGMGVFFTIYFIVGLPAPGIAGWLYDITGTTLAPMTFASVLCLLAAASNFCFRTTLNRGAALTPR